MAPLVKTLKRLSSPPEFSSRERRNFPHEELDNDISTLIMETLFPVKNTHYLLEPERAPINVCLWILVDLTTNRSQPPDALSYTGLG